MFVKAFVCVIFPASAVQCVQAVVSVTIKYTFFWMEYPMREVLLKTASLVNSSTFFL
jgi:hypothetical protein